MDDDEFPSLKALSAKTSPEVDEALSGIGRTEDLVFSPDGRRLAVVGFTEGKILLLDVKIDAAVKPGRVRLNC